MAQNRSSAVMAQRHEAPDTLDYFPTPPWATRALTERLAERHPLASQRVWEPACGEGHMVRPLRERFWAVIATDVHDYGAKGGQSEVADFLLQWHRPRVRTDWVITNPPFNLAEQFAQTALAIAPIGVALLVRTAFLEGQSRFKTLFRNLPPRRVLIFAERVVMMKGRLLDPTRPYRDEQGQLRRPSSATSYAWLIWEDEGTGTELEWIAPCRERLTRPGDYPDPPPADDCPTFFGSPLE